jgi:hypothetical protein
MCQNSGRENLSDQELHQPEGKDEASQSGPRPGNCQIRTYQNELAQDKGNTQEMLDGICRYYQQKFTILWKQIST